ncbi:hypothetical protein [Anabaena sp. UHCC 0451]|uniref:hypothetical protein n=1 Tax=Anabaena sp. UHCC 0451 TaxID=2055235 RepID=UPI002B2154A1|nr:hypothetical protein [Anabaena sp. UHCC 0451]MEA5575574.1 hypothetical protein [Anabaena sp. UHCC 0451]
MLKKINSIISKNTEIFQEISDNQAAFISGGMEIPVASDIPNPPVDLLNSLPPTFLLEVIPLVASLTV